LSSIDQYQACKVGPPEAISGWSGPVWCWWWSCQ